MTSPIPRQAAVFCAGEGTRLRPLTAHCPKPMLPVAGRPILAYLLEWLAEQGVQTVAINLHHRPDALTREIGDGAAFGLRVAYTREPSLLGSAGALRPMASILTETFVAIYGDTLTTLPLEPLTRLHSESGALFTMALIDHPRPTEAGIVALEDTKPWHGGLAGRVMRILEKPRPDEIFSTIANAGIFIIDPAAIELVPAYRPSDIARDLIPAILASGGIVAGWLVPTDAVISDVGTPDGYATAQTEWPPHWQARALRSAT
ncbi:MAG: NDP-sugar synthase [Chloroflexota bacterium]|nr:MAG: NDP-sugar synthase [Chloroflexota bacterium]